MTLDTLKNANRVIGIKQVSKAVKRNSAKAVFVASDADSRVVEPLKVLCRDGNIQIDMTSTMQAIGKACGIEVGASAAAVLK